MKSSLLLGLSAILITGASFSLTKVDMAGSATNEIQVPKNNIQIAQAHEALGSFITVDENHPTTGTVRLIKEETQSYLQLSDDFSTARGPEVEVILYRGNSIPVNLEEGSYVTIAPLKSFDGGQRYSLPPDINLSEFGAVGIWCRQFNVTFGYVAL